MDYSLDPFISSICFSVRGKAHGARVECPILNRTLERLRRDLDEVRPGEKYDTVSQVLQGHSENKCKFCSMQALVSVLYSKVWLAAMSPGLGLYSRSDKTREHKQSFLWALY
jgi:hypothetical protein